MDESTSTIVNRPGRGDLALLEKLATRLNLLYDAVLEPGDGETAAWFSERGIGRHRELASVPGLMPGMLLVHLGEEPPTGELVTEVTRRGMSLLTRDTVTGIAGDGAGTLSRTAVVERYHRLLDDYFPTSRGTSTQVKLAACLAEVATLWGAAGVVALAEGPRRGSLVVVAQRGLTLPNDYSIRPTGGTALDRSFSRGKSEIVEDLSKGNAGMPPGMEEGSAACVPVKTGAENIGVLLSWSDRPGLFEASDLPALSLFASYVALAQAFDDLGERLGESLITDPLTGLLNRRQFESRLEQEVLRAQRYTLTLSLILFSVDDFDRYTDACGHMLANLALSDVASIFSRGVREVDLVARVDEDIFAAVLPETNRLGALQLAYRLRSDVAGYPFPSPENGEAVPLGLSAGVSSFPSSANDFEELFSRAAEALEEAKRMGPSTIKLYDE